MGANPHKHLNYVYRERDPMGANHHKHLNFFLSRGGGNQHPLGPKIPWKS